ncbi:NTP transferase domain-containing protein [Serratia microhaemolytica]|uniref:NTP transferase domain-containing protein n=1 Tax=Serratia microhaemolytica TaxID=2675110 RepID=UPI001F0C4914|nr:NTP transferase domain-containing protein [Serratia microhaemolytica]
MANIDCVMLAAGMSTRMGRWKMMLPYGDSTILDSAIANALGFCQRVIVVSGFRGEELQARYQQHPQVDVVHNVNYQQGMFSSIRLGTEQVRSSYFFLALGDMPCITHWIYAALWQEKGPFTLIPRCSHGKGHPILLPAAMIERIRAADLGLSMKQVIEQGDYRFLEVGDQNIHCDIDTPDEYQQLQQRQLCQQSQVKAAQATTIFPLPR